GGRFDENVFTLGAAHDPFDALRAVDRRRERQLRFLSGEAREIGELGERPVQPRRRYLESVEIDVLDGEEPRQMIRNPGAILDVDAFRLVDEHADELASGRHVDVDQLIAQCGQRSLQQFTDVRVHAFVYAKQNRKTKKKWAAPSPFISSLLTYRFLLVSLG